MSIRTQDIRADIVADPRDLEVETWEQREARAMRERFRARTGMIFVGGVPRLDLAPESPEHAPKLARCMVPRCRQRGHRFGLCGKHFERYSIHNDKRREAGQPGLSVAGWLEVR